MAYYSKNKAELAKIGEETFAIIDDIFSFSGAGGRNTKPSPSAIGRNQQQLFHHQYQYQYQPQQTYLVQQQVMMYDHHAPNYRATHERVITCNDAAKMYGGTMFVEYPKRKPARKGFFF